MNQDGNGQNAQENYANQNSQDGSRAGGVDNNAWELILPPSERERNADAVAPEAPRRWSAEVQRYFRMLARQAQIERQRAANSGDGE